MSLTCLQVHRNKKQASAEMTRAVQAAFKELGCDGLFVVPRSPCEAAVEHIIVTIIAGYLPTYAASERMCFGKVKPLPIGPFSLEHVQDAFTR